MSTDKNKNPEQKKASSDKGYRKPPKDYQFKKGAPSPNKYGRGGDPKKKKKAASTPNSGKFSRELLEELGRTVTFTENGKQKKLPKSQLIFRALTNEASKAKPSIAIPLLKMYKAAADEEQYLRNQRYEWAVKYKRDWYACERNRKSHDDPSSVPLPLPYARHVVTNADDLSVSIDGPTDEGELYDYKCMIAQIVKSEIDIEKAELQGLDDENSDIGIQRMFLAEARKLIPRDDPVWLEFAPGYRRAIIDYHYYYGPEPKLPEKAFEVPDDLSESIRKERPKASLEARKWAQQNEKDRKKFRAFMREKLQELMGEDWNTRLDQSFHQPRDVDWDYIRYQFETGTFDRASYGFTDEELEAVAGSEEEKAFFAWDREQDE